MYRYHKIILFITFIIIFLLTYLLKCNFQDIASECISIISIAMAIYAICISSLISSPLLEKLKLTLDKQIKHKTQLGVLKCYIQIAMIISILTIVFACISKLTSLKFENMILSKEILIEIFDKLNLLQFFSSTCFALFALNFVFIWLIFIFIINRQVDK